MLSSCPVFPHLNQQTLDWFLFPVSHLDPPPLCPLLPIMLSSIMVCAVVSLCEPAQHGGVVMTGDTGPSFQTSGDELV